MLHSNSNIDRPRGIFPTAVSFFRWLDVGSDTDIVQALSFQRQTTKGTVEMVLGVAQRVRRRSHLHLFDGSICSTHHRHTSQTDGCASFHAAISIGEVGWNDEDNSLYGDQKIDDGRHCTPCDQLDEGLHAFMIDSSSTEEVL